MTDKEIRIWFMEHYDYNPISGIFTNRISGNHVTTRHIPKGYILIGGPGKKTYLAHRVAYLIMDGEWPDQVDHHNRIRDDNRWFNLLPADQFINAQNHSLRKTNTTGLTGIERRKGKWRATLERFGHRERSGWLATRDEAAEFRNEMLGKFHRGEWPGS